MSIAQEVTHIAIFLPHCARNGEVGYSCLNLLPSLFSKSLLPRQKVDSAKREFMAVGVQETHHGVMVSGTFLFLVLFFGGRL
jgi:hypothetical protein